MKKVTVIELSEQTGFTRSQIYYLNKTHKLINIEGKINLEDALRIITTLKIKKTKITNEENFRQILNMLNLQNITLQKQLDLAHEREKYYLAELANYRQNLDSKTSPLPPNVEGNTQTLLENNVVDTVENSRKPMQLGSEYHVRLDSYQTNNEEIKSVNEAGLPQLPTKSIYNEMILPETKSWDNDSKNRSTEKNDDAVIGTPFPIQDKTKSLLNKIRQKKPTAQVVKRTNKNISIIPTSCKSDRTPINKSIEDQDKIDKKDRHNYGQ